MAEQTYSQANAIGMVAIVLLVLTLVIGAVFVVTGLTAGPPVLPQA